MLLVCSPADIHATQTLAHCVLLLCLVSLQRGVCPRGESCYMTHSMFEYYMHREFSSTRL